MSHASAVMPAVRWECPSTEEVHAEHADFVWRTLQRFNVCHQDLDDLMQEVFVVVHRRLGSFDGSARMTTWLFGICLRVVAGYRRRAFRRREQPSDACQIATALVAGESPEESLARHDARQQLAAALDALSLEQRAAFVMFELEQMSCAEIADVMGTAVGTVHSRLHAAREAFAKAARRLRARSPQGDAP